MKIDFGTGILSLNGAPLLVGEGKPWTAGALAADSLLAPRPNSPYSVSQISERYALALRIVKAGVEDITIGEASLIQEAVAANCAPIAAAQIIALTNGEQAI